jgi:DNA-binding transcriptional LysR family regulator
MSATLDDIAIFALTVQAGSLSAAAAQRRVPKSTISRAITRLEEHLGAKLLTRSPRNTGLTDAGRQYFAQVAPHVAGLRDAEDSLRAGRNEVHGVLRITAAPDIGEVLSSVLVGFCARYPRVQTVVELSTRIVNLQSEGFDVAIRATNKPDPNTVAKKLRDAHIGLYAAPQYLATRGTPATPSALAEHDCVLFRERTQWKLQRGEGDSKELAQVDVRGRISGDEFNFVRSAVKAGAGIGPLPRCYAESDERAGVLVRVLPSWTNHGASTLWLLYPAQRSVSPRVKAFRDYALAVLQVDERP